LLGILHVLTKTSLVFVALVKTVDHLLCVVALTNSTILGTYQTIKVIISNLGAWVLVFGFVLDASLLATVKRTHVHIHHLDFPVVFSILSCILL
jgi:hypothetical protein